MDGQDKQAQDFHSRDYCACPAWYQVNSELSKKNKKKKQTQMINYPAHTRMQLTLYDNNYINYMTYICICSMLFLQTGRVVY